MRNNIFFIWVVTISLNAHAGDSNCASFVDSVLDHYRRNGEEIASYQSHKCAEVIRDLDDPFGSDYKTDAPRIYQADACAMIIVRASFKEIQDVAVYDSLNGFTLIRSFKEEETSVSRLGDGETGRLHFINHSKEDGGLFRKEEFITRANYDLSADRVRLMKWQVGLFRNVYSHDYTLQCH